MADDPMRRTAALLAPIEGRDGGGRGDLGRLGDLARTAMRLRHLSPCTEAALLRWMRRYHDFHGRSDPATLGAEHVTAFLTSLATDAHVAAGTQDQALAALLFLWS